MIFNALKTSEANSEILPSVFWHQFLRQRLSSISNYVSLNLLRLPKGRWITRYTRLLLAFLVSGMMHALTDVGQGYSWKSSGSIHFFLTQWLGIVVEDTVQGAYCSVSPSRTFKDSEGREPLNRGIQKCWIRVIGYVWLLLFLAWSTPVWIYPALRVNLGEDKDIALPFSTLSLLKGVISDREIRVA